jgi:ATP-binding cassette subfamily C protein LapB
MDDANFLDPKMSSIKKAFAIFMNRIAALEGFSVPKHRFLFSTENLHGTVLESFQIASWAKETWLTLFPQGEVKEITVELMPGHLPLLWLSHDESEVKIITGVLSNGKVNAEDEFGNNSSLNKEMLLQGRMFVFTVNAEGHRNQESLKSAEDWFFFAIKKRKGPFVEAIIASFLVSTLTLAISFYSMQVYDRVVPTHSYSTLIVITIGALIAITLELITKQIRSKILDKACKFIDVELSSVFFGQMLSIRMDARPKTIGTFASQIKQFELVRSFMTASTLFVIADLPFVLFFIIVIWMIGGMIAIVPLSLLPISIGAGLYGKWKIARLTEKHLEETNQKSGVLVEAIDGIESIKAVGGEWKMLDQWRKLTLSNADKELHIRDASTITASITQTIQQLSFILLTAAGVYAIGAGKITMGALMACSIISSRALSPISQIAGKIIQWQHAKAALKGLNDMMFLPKDREDGLRLTIPDQCKGSIKLETVTFSYTKNQEALKQINLAINPGEKIAIIGPVGSGKSSLIKMLSGLYKPTQGKVFLDDVDITHISPEFLRESIGYLTQDIRLFSGSLRSNLTLGLASPSDSVILHACQQTGLLPFIKSHPKGLELPIYEGGRGLSGGQRQLVGLTRMLIAKPQVLLLDEPTASMDRDLELKILTSLFNEIGANTTLVISSHKTSVFQFVSRIIVLDKGKIVIDGPKDTVLNNLAKRGPAKQSSAV